ncbi:MAG: response regulator [Desulfitobacteriaceae bacterium]|nr:response regulator [Desulfitobacteriaceae bacterium]
MYTILLVDDEALERAAWKYMVEKYYSGFIKIIGEAKNGNEAVDLAKMLTPDIILMDVKMPGIDGIKASSLIKDFLPQTKIIVISAYDDFSYAQDSLKFGAADYLLKPIQLEEMLGVIRQQITDLEKEKESLEEESLLHERLQKMIPYIKIGFIAGWLEGELRTEVEIQERADFLGISPLPQQVMVANIDHFRKQTSGKTEHERQILKQKIYEEISKATEDFNQGLCIPHTGDKYVILIFPKENESREQMRKRSLRLAESTRRQIEENPFIHATITVGIGRHYPKNTDLPFSYQEALRALEHRLYTGSNQVIHIDDVLPLDDEIPNYPFAIEKELVTYTRLGDLEQAQYWLNILLDKIITKTNKQPELLKMRLLELLFILSREAIESGASYSEITRGSYSYLKDLQQIEDFHELREWVNNMVEHLIKLVQYSHHTRQQDIPQRVVIYMHQHYMEDIALEEIAGVFYLTPSYLSRIFKQAYGVNFIDYLTCLRLDEAKKLLTTTLDPINSIAKRVGYNDHKYFSTVFKKNESCTPSEYRRKVFLCS